MQATIIKGFPNWLTFILAFCITVISTVFIQNYLRVDVPEVTPFNTKPYQDSILRLKNDKQSMIIKYDSLSKIKQKIDYRNGEIEIQFEPKYVYLKGATPNELDSTIMLAVFGTK